MLVSFNWLKTYFDSDSLPSPEELASLLNQHSYEVEGVEEKNGDTLLDLDVLPNRSSDSLSHIGIAREVSVLTGAKCILPEAHVEGKESIEELLSLSVDEEIARRALKRVVSDVTVGPSPEWLVQRLTSLGQRSINNIVDITNFVMLETGQPVHAFDYDKITGDGIKEVNIRRARDGEKIVLLDEEEYTLDPSIPVIADAEKALDVAGIKGGEASGVDENTKRILLSACSFDPVMIRLAARKLNIRTDASKRFENNVPPATTMYAMERLSALVEEIAGGSLSTVSDVYPSPQEPISVPVSLEEVNSLLGANISSEEVEDILMKLEFNVLSTEDGFTVAAPLWRTDITLPVDVIEEVGRVYGYDRIQAVVPEKVKVSPSKEHYYREVIRDVLVSLGFNEAYLYSFTNTGEIEVENKIASDKGFLRSNLAEGLKSALERNSAWAPMLEENVLKMFEIGHVFNDTREYTALAIGVQKTEKGGDTEETYIKEALASLKETGIKIEGIIEDGVLEVCLDDVFESLADPKDISVTEIDDSGFSFSSISQYPFALRDVAVWVPSDTDEEEVRKLIKAEAGELLVRLSCFDVYEKEGRTSYAFNLVFQSQEKTLSDEEVNEIMDRVYGRMEDQKGWEIR